jgi:hypothetical protein
MSTATTPNPNGQITQAPFYKPEATYVDELAVGQFATFDAFYGIEEVLHVNREYLDNGVLCMHMHVRRRPPESVGRFVVRAAREPITRWMAQ